MTAYDPKQEQAIAGFRQEIDALDDKLIELLIERIGIVSQVGSIKRTHYPGQCPLRAGREADMVRRIIKRFEGTAFDPAAAAAMWRILIGSSTCVETPLTVSVFAPINNETFYWLGREYFGPTASINRQPHVNRVVGDVIEGKAMIGIVPILESGDTNNWWTNLMTPGSPKIFAHIPFVYSSAATPAGMAIARIQADPTGDDVSFVALDVDHNVSQHRLQSVFAQSQLSVRWISITPSVASSRRHLIEIKGYVTPEDDALKSALAALGASVLQVGYLGAYAVPVVIKPNQSVAHVASAS